MKSLDVLAGIFFAIAVVAFATITALSVKNCAEGVAPKPPLNLDGVGLDPAATVCREIADHVYLCHSERRVYVCLENGSTIDCGSISTLPEDYL
jgi:hypothetical protein